MLRIHYNWQDENECEMYAIQSDASWHVYLTRAELSIIASNNFNLSEIDKILTFKFSRKLNYTSLNYQELHHYKRLMYHIQICLRFPL